MAAIVVNLRPHLVGLLIGFIIGLERERAHPRGEQALGLRTFSLLGLLGTLSAQDTPSLLGIMIAAFALGAILLGYFRSTAHAAKGDYGLTTEFAGGVVFILGFISTDDPALAGVLGAFVLALLAGRDWLHGFTRRKITNKEADALISLIVVGAGVLPLLPQHPLDPWGVFIPFKLGMLIWLMALIQFLSYVLLKVFGEKAGFVLGGFLSGFVSSTATFANIRQQLSSNSSPFAGLVAYGMMAIAATTLLTVGVIFASSQSLFQSLMWNFGAVIVATTVISGIAVLRKTEATPQQQNAHQKDPLNWKKQLSFAVGLFTVITLTKLAAEYLGSSALIAVSFLSGLFELQGVAYAIAATESPTTQTVLAMTAAYTASLISKIFLITTSTPTNKKQKLYYITTLIILIAIFLAPLLIPTQNSSTESPKEEQPQPKPQKGSLPA